MKDYQNFKECDYMKDIVLYCRACKYRTYNSFCK